MKWRQSLALSAVFAALTALGLLVFPGHSFLLSDTQIYIPLFEHLRDSRLLNSDLILSGAHLSYTIYDEVSLALNRTLGFSFEQVLFGQQFVFRWLGYWGAFWLARACGLPLAASVLTSTLLWLGAFVYGPAIITTEFEPVPRGFAVPLVVASLGALAVGHRNASAVLIAIAFLYHAPAVWPVLLIALILRDWRTLSTVAGAAILLLSFAHYQPGTVQAQPFFSLIDPVHREILQTRAAYNWISLWPWQYWAQYLLTASLALAAFARVRTTLPPAVQPYFRWMPLIGLAMMPISYLLLEQLGWALFPQVQPMRSLLYCHLFCQWLAPLAAWREIKDRNWSRAACWMIVPLSLSLRGDLLNIPPDGWWKQALLLVVLFAAVYIAAKWPRREWAWAACFLVSLFFGDVLNARAYKPIASSALDALAVWAKDRTPTDSVFLFGDLGRRLEPGIFRARSTRAVYVCWKQGGQVNYFPQYAQIWWERWRALLAPNHPPLDYNDLRRRGIHYLVLTTQNPTKEIPAVYASPGYRVYQLNP